LRYFLRFAASIFNSPALNPLRDAIKRLCWRLHEAQQDIVTKGIFFVTGLIFENELGSFPKRGKQMATGSRVRFQASPAWM
jgi:hypothetical protein